MIQLTWSDIHLCDKAMEDKLSLFPEERGEKDMYRNTINKQENNQYKSITIRNDLSCGLLALIKCS